MYQTSFEERRVTGGLWLLKKNQPITTIPTSFILIVVSFISNILLKSAVIAFRSRCNLNTSIRKQSTVTISTGLSSLVAVEEQSKFIWRPNTSMNSRQVLS